MRRAMRSTSQMGRADKIAAVSFAHARCRLRLWALALSAAMMTALTAPPLRAQSYTAPPGRDEAASKPRPAAEAQPRIGIGQAGSLDREYDAYLAWKQTINDEYNLDFGLDFSFFSQVGTPHGGPAVWFASYYPGVTWRPFTNTAFGSGQFDVVAGNQVYFSKANTATQTEHLGLITFPSDWLSDELFWAAIVYTHTLPDAMDWLSVSGGYYSLYPLDPNEYAGNAQTSFISYPFAQDATQTFPDSGLGAYATAQLAHQIQLAGGFQGATSLSGRAIGRRRADPKKYLYWGSLQWRPSLPGLGDGLYSLLVYQEPFIQGSLLRSTGYSFSASQHLTEKWGVFLRVNGASGAAANITTSIAMGGIRNDPLGLDPNDQAGIALAWDKTNQKAVGPIEGGTRGGEWVTEIFYSYTVFKGLHLTPDAQVFWNPALDRSRGPAAVFTLRTTLFF